MKHTGIKRIRDCRSAKPPAKPNISLLPTAGYLLIFLFTGIFAFPGIPWSQEKAIAPCPFLPGSGLPGSDQPESSLLESDQLESSQSDSGLIASLDTDSAEVGSIVSLNLDYRLPEGAGLPGEVKVKGLEDLTVLGQSVGSGKITIKLLVDQLGAWKTGRLSLTFLDEAGNSRVMETDPVSLTVLSNLGENPEESELKAIQGIMPTMTPWMKYLPWAAGLFCLLLVLTGVVWWYQRQRRKRGSPLFLDPPHIRARKEMEALEAQRFFEKGDFKAFYFRYSEILRHYLESIRGFPAAEFTTEEIAFHIDDASDRTLLSLLRQADLVKFADDIPTPARKDEEMKRALTYIRETSPEANIENSKEGA